MRKTSTSSLKAPATRLIEDQLEQVSAGGPTELAQQELDLVAAGYQNEMLQRASDDRNVTVWTLKNALPMK